MKIALVVYNNMTLLDFAGVYDPISRLKTMGFVSTITYHICARTDRVRSSEGAVLVADQVIPDLSCYDLVIIPGGDGVRDLAGDRAFLAWISVASERTTVAAVCGGSLLLGAAGMLRTKKATTHPALSGLLSNFAREVTHDRVVDDGTVITAGGVTAAIDLGLYLCEKIAGADVRERIAQQMDYPHYRV